jgi:VanZ family protein
MLADKRLNMVSRFAAIFSLPILAGVIGGELGPAQSVFGMSDKTMHFTAYFLLALLSTFVFKAGWRAIFAIAGMILMGGLLEIVQGFIGRDMDIFDEIANACGAIGGGIMGWAILVLLTRCVLVDRKPAV